MNFNIINVNNFNLKDFFRGLNKWQKFFCILIILCCLIATFIFIFLYFYPKQSQKDNVLSANKSIINIDPNNNLNMGGNKLNIVGDVNNTSISQIINPSLLPEVSYRIFTPSKKETNGLFSTIFEIRIYYPQGTKEPTILISNILKCPSPDGTNTLSSLAPNGKIIYLKCTSNNPIEYIDGLFTYK